MEQYLFFLFVRLAVSASLASILARPMVVQKMLLAEERELGQRIRLALAFALAFGTSVAIRVLSRNNYQAVDLGLEGSLLCGLVGGYVSGLTAGILISLPALPREILSIALFPAVGVIGGLLRDLAPEKEEIWRLSPFFGFGLVKILRFTVSYHRLMFQAAFLLTVFFIEFVRFNVPALIGEQYLFHLKLEPEGSLMLLATYLTTLFAVILPLKVWNNTRNERKLEIQQVLLSEARLAALTRQINPHFLFNTLNSVSSLIRTNPEQARTMVYKLSTILRRLLRKQENLSSMREELGFIEDYLAIEMVRFGEKLKFEKPIDPKPIEMFIPNMVLKPVVENSIKHGLGPKVQGGVIRLSSQTSGGRLLIIVEDDGVGIPEEKLKNLFEQGIGVSNVNERLKVLYGTDFRLSIHSIEGKGTKTEIEIPQLTSVLAAVS